MTTPTSTERPDTSLARDLIYAGRYYLLSRRGLLILATILIVAGAASNWSWLVATGIAPILFAVLPCAVMCGLGLCMHKFFGNSHASESSQSRDSNVQTIGLSAPLKGSEPSSCCDKPADMTALPASKNSPPLDERRDPYA